MDLFEQLKRDEGLKLKPYRDTVGKLTIGYGRNLDDEGLTEAEANYLLQSDVARVEAAIAQFLPRTLLDAHDGTPEAQARYAVCVNMAFNLGVSGFAKFRDMIGWMAEGNWSQTAVAMLNSQWAKQVGARAKRLAQQMDSGNWT